ncbi:MAG TPA: amidohydrolase family protein [Chloroflexia bacterium]|nr:amidohydrolase family protein [Chloroflexia bacterium]
MRQMLENCQVITCEDTNEPQVIRDAAILINGNIIEAVGRQEELAALRQPLEPRQVRDMGGRWIMPGLMNMHVHLGLALPGTGALMAQVEDDMDLTMRAYRNALDSIQAGVTFLRTVGDARFVDLHIKRAINNGTLKGPRLFCAGHIVIITGGHGTGRGAREADGPEGFRQAVREQLRAGADTIKLAITGGIAGEHEAITDSQATFAEMEAAAQAAHNAGKRITAHAGSAVAITQGIQAGLDCIEHGYFLDGWTVDLMVKNNTYLVPTLSVSRAPDYMRERGCPQWMIDKALKAGEGHMESYRLALKAGLPIAMGTDMLPAEAYDGTLATYREMEWMVEGGMSTHQALLSATAKAAELCRVQDKLGSVTAGKYADLIAMPGSPLENMRNLRDLDFVMKDGEIFRNFI